MSLLLALTAGGGGGTAYADSLLAGAYAIAGQTVTDTVARVDSLSAGAYVIAGQDITDAISYSDDLAAGAYVIAGQDITDVIVTANTDGGGGRPYWQPYLMDDWSKKIPQKAVKAIERLAKSPVPIDDAEKQLMQELAQYEARYAEMLRSLRQSEVQTLALLQLQMLALIELDYLDDEEDAIIALLCA